MFITMSRHEIVRDASEKRLTRREATELLSLSYRQVQRQSWQAFSAPH